MNSQSNPKLKLLIVDDEPDNLDLLYRTFHRDYKVLRAESGPAALEILAKEGEVAVIISDQRMPKMSGTEFLSLTAAQYPDVIRIILTGYTDVEDLVEAINAGKVFKFVTKPWDAEELRALVSQAVDTHNVLKARTNELRRALSQESLLYAVTNTIRSAPNYQQMLQRIVETVGQMFEVSCCLLRPFQDGRVADEWFVYQKAESKGLRGDSEARRDASSARLSPDLLPDLVWETLDVEVIQDAQTDDRVLSWDNEQRLQAYQAANIRSSLIVPLFYQMELMAVLALHQFDRPRQWEDHEVQLVITVADQAALALSQARAYEQVRALAKRETLVNTITTAIRSSLDPQNIFAAITQQLGQALQVDGCALSLWTEDDEYVQCVGLYDTNRDTVAVKQGFNNSEVVANPPSPQTAAESAAANPPGWVFAHPSLPQSLVPIRGNPVLLQVMVSKEPVAIEDLNERPDLNVTELQVRSPARALLVVPLISEGKIIGSISLRQNCSTRRWNLSDIDLAQIVATQAALAVQQSRLYQTTRQQAERLLEADRLKTEFFQNISHEFRTPLTLTIGPLESACGRKEDLPYEQAVIALRNSRRLLRLVNQLLDLQRLDAGRMQPSFRPCDLVGFCYSTAESFRAYCDKKGLHLITQLQDCPLLYLDIERFDKVIYNLLSNAVKFTPEGGTITLTVEPAGAHCLLQVKDTGIGIRTEQIPYLFERFHQAEGSASRSYEGSGLGLALVKELVELHGGQISVDSVYGEGTTFTVWLHFGSTHLPPERVLEIPAEFHASKAAVELADVEADLSEDEAENHNFEALEPINSETVAGTVLVVDDNPDLRFYVSGILRESGFAVLLARNGEEGFAVAKNRRPDLIVTDLMMPVISGLDLIRMIRQDEDLRGTPAILLTAKADADTRIEGVERGADAYLSKPFNDRELLAEVRNLIALKQNERRVQQLNNYLTESVLRRFLPPSMVKAAAAGDLALDLRPEPRLITILFSDIVGFTQMANTLRSRRVAELLNEYLAAMTKAIFDSGGTVDKFVGDAVMALFGAPEELTPNEQVRRAIAAARLMLRALKQLNERWLEQGIVGENGVPPVRFRCGIHQGTAVVGMFGGPDRSDYTAIGPSVNIAARLQEVAEPNSVLISAAVADYVEENRIVKYKPLQLKGIDETVLTFMLNCD
ncbi:MAG: response regulator [Microcoleus sp. PH2017_29_MFU_D_A]|uniref:response regulator n=1 Tax=unclassified Microcoleus TaxID=2642155 RepID=UPI001D562ED2|nr:MULTISPECIES: response regulator [unclassified Microcoleus]MCC3420142.1 response regulator [Microcoleus sp. PH2017_07_MST_O_A]MCC3441645.1 response regulator [Microcoleus sp. PH2017_03_ELD_O_A]MCC3466835.1 response regulator [Microcoleus sp. PH2017_06_SFM_O_A]MCC3505303.1 response regulator [Microcoleus sp. PH2017_19_SFW_U_A]TAE13158.1 MAG: response regulator [Oscillatoriales cyanobacterium]